MPKTTRVVITGAPGTGKTTVLEKLNSKGYPVLPEMARALIKEQQALDSELLPWKAHKRFGEALYARQVQQYHQAQEGQISFYDRGILDNLGYLRRDGIQNIALEEKAHSYPYFPKVFFTPPWQEIYNQDAERWEDFELMLDIHQALQAIYRDFGYQLIEVPRLAPEKRVDFILHQLTL